MVRYIHKKILLIGVFLIPLNVLGQWDKKCSVIRTETEKIKNSFPEAKIINDISTFVINGKNELIDSFKKHVPAGYYENKKQFSCNSERADEI